MNSQSKNRRRRALRASALFLSYMTHVNCFSPSPNTSQRRQQVQFHASTNNIDQSDATMSTALCVIPPDEAWDTIQRARHLTRDRTFHKWPPAIRLFHPFCPRAQLSNVALEIARIVEKHDLSPFPVSLDSWTIVPHMEAIEADWDAMQQLPDQQKVEVRKKEETEVDRLIAEEERLGKERLIARSRRKKLGNNKGQSRAEVEAARQENKEDEKFEKDSPRDLLEKQKRMYEEFNGPCVLCLEPDQESKERLTRLRELLKEELFQDYDKFSPSSSVSTTNSLPRAVLEAEESSFRPIVPVASFPTVTSAVEMARKLKGLWEPLPFNVTDFHLISYEDDLPLEQGDIEYSGNVEYNLKKTSWRHADIEEETLTTKGQFGCDALVMLMGEEVDTDEEGSREMVDIIMSQGSPGGFEMEPEASDDALSSSEERTAGEEVEDGDTADLELWLSEDQWDEGTVVVIDRTHFFTGDMRIYNGMPASSAMDAKDRVFGLGGHASARRKTSPHRAAGVRKDGEYGYKESDFV